MGNRKRKSIWRQYLVAKFKNAQHLFMGWHIGIDYDCMDHIPTVTCHGNSRTHDWNPAIPCPTMDWEVTFKVHHGHTVWEWSQSGHWGLKKTTKLTSWTLQYCRPSKTQNRGNKKQQHTVSASSILSAKLSQMQLSIINNEFIRLHHLLHSMPRQFDQPTYLKCNYQIIHNEFICLHHLLHSVPCQFYQPIYLQCSHQSLIKKSTVCITYFTQSASPTSPSALSILSANLPPMYSLITNKEVNCLHHLLHSACITYFTQCLVNFISQLISNVLIDH